ncbi:MAG TPA: S9 family peptidase [Vicinamibacterales bacterium]|nr:S9 family peptidase [Vicinamibacterales bacterium]
MRFCLVMISTAMISAAALNAANPLPIDKALDIREPSDLHFSPAGKHVAFTVSEPPTATKPSQRHIWVLDTGTGTVRQWTDSSKSEQTPRWSPDGSTLAFLSDREDVMQIWLMPVNGGASVKLTTGKNAVETFRWSRDGKEIAFLAADPRTPEDEKKQRDQDDARVIDVDHRPNGLWIVDLGGKNAKRVTRAPWHLRDLEWLDDDNKHVLAIGTDQPTAERRGRERLYSVALDDGTLDEIFAPKGPFQRIQVSPDAKTVGFVSSPEDGPSAQDLFLMPLSTRVAKDVTATRDRLVTQFQWLNNTEIAALFNSGFRSDLATVGGVPRTLVTNESLEVSAFAVNARGTVAYVAQSAAVPPEIYLEGKPVSHFNDEFAAAASLVKPEVYRYQSLDGTPIEAALFRGAGSSATQLQPLVVLVHGGPAGAWTNRFDALTYLLVSRGYTVMQPNIRGSNGYGQKFLTSNRGDWGGGDYKDVIAGVDDLIRRKIADPARLAIAGWSYGGYMAEWAITQTTRFKAAISGAGMADLATEFGTEASPEGDEWYYGTPYENLAGFQHSSPIVFIKNAKTPTLILQGEADTTDPVSQSQMLYRGLKRYNVPAEFVVYPREPHGLRERYHIVDRYRRSLEWIEKYLGPANTEPQG